MPVASPCMASGIGANTLDKSACQGAPCIAPYPDGLLDTGLPRSAASESAGPFRLAALPSRAPEFELLHSAVLQSTCPMSVHVAYKGKRTCIAWCMPQRPHG
jgi:hypothetical protein